MLITLIYNKQPYPLELEPDDRLAVAFDFLCEVTQLSRHNSTLIHNGKKLHPATFVQDTGLKDNDKVLIIGSTQAEVDFVKNARADPLVKGFDALERDERARRKRTKRLQQSFWGTKQHPEYKFCQMKAEYKYTTPTPYEAEALLNKLATDPAIVKIMTERRFVVGLLTEMSPQEAQERMRSEGKNGVDLLGYNQNAGQKIVLRLRTDDVKGFRPYYDLMNTLIHEITHNVHGPHDDKFWALFRELKKDYDTFHDSYTRGGRALAAEAAPMNLDSSDDEVTSHVLGGETKVPQSPEEQRRIALLRAEERLLEQQQIKGFSQIKGLTPSASSTAVPEPCCGADHSKPEEKNADTERNPEGSKPTIEKVENINTELLLPETDLINDAGEAPMSIDGGAESDMVMDASPAHNQNRGFSAEGNVPQPEDSNDIPVANIKTPLVDVELPVIINLPPTEDELMLPEELGAGFKWSQDFRNALQNVPEGLAIIRTLATNLRNNPNEEKFRTVKTSNAKIAKIVQQPDVQKAFAMLGFHPNEDKSIYQISAGHVDIGKFYMATEILNDM